MTPPAAEQPTGMIFELYKLHVEMADRVSARRATANGFFATVETALVAAVGLLRPTTHSSSTTAHGATQAAEHIDRFGPILASVAGIAFAFAWLVMLLRYRRLNDAKFQVIHKLEDQLPAQPYQAEWKLLERPKERRWGPKFFELGQVERAVPVIFMGLFAAAIIRFATL